MSICPRCLWEFFPVSKGTKPDVISDGVYSHDCISGYIRPYPQMLCTLCKRFGTKDDTSIRSKRTITFINRDRKMKRFREDASRESESRVGKYLKTLQEESPLESQSDQLSTESLPNESSLGMEVVR